VKAYWVELSGENLPLARAELEGAVAALGGAGPDPDATGPAANVALVSLPDVEAARTLAGRLALARRVLDPFEESGAPELRRRFLREGRSAATASIRRVRGSPSSPAGEDPIHTLAAAYLEGGGSIDLDDPRRRFWTISGPGGAERAAVEVGPVDRPRMEERRMPKLPYRRPVSLPPRLARVAVNLARVRPGDRVVDPFVGTGALLLEAAVLGARVSGGDLDPEMVRGTLRNLAAFGYEPERLAVVDAASPFRPPGEGRWDAIVTDPPYGRASGTRGEDPVELLARALPGWAERLRPGGRVSVVVAGGPDPLREPWVRLHSIPDRVHRSLTREFRVYARSDELTGW
jgi:putative methyltransferase (TIGR01177 family)